MEIIGPLRDPRVEIDGEFLCALPTCVTRLFDEQLIRCGYCRKDYCQEHIRRFDGDSYCERCAKCHCGNDAVEACGLCAEPRCERHLQTATDLDDATGYHDQYICCSPCCTTV